MDTDASSAGYQPGSVAGPGGTGNCAPTPGGAPRAGRPSLTGRTSVFFVGIPGQRPGVRARARDEPRLVTILPGVPDIADEPGGRRPAFPRNRSADAGYRRQRAAEAMSPGNPVLSARAPDDVSGRGDVSADGALTGR